MELTEEQRARISHNKEIARQRLEERNKRLAQNNSSNNNSDVYIPMSSSNLSTSGPKPKKIASLSLNSVLSNTNNNFIEISSKNLSKPVHNSNLSKVHIQFFVHNRYRLKVFLF